MEATLATKPQRHDGFGPDPLLPRQTRPVATAAGRSRAVLKREVAQLCPPVPGVYGILDRAGTLIYVGKSKSLRHRLLSYF
jgi:excinuclease ABC subunit C